jgi:hypothetical protein
MKTMTATRIRPLLLAFSTGVALYAAAPAQAAGKYDGIWVVDIPASTPISSSYTSTCPADRFPLEIRDNQIIGSLHRVLNDGSERTAVESGSGRDARPVLGSVQPDGSVTAQWENYKASGTLQDATGTVTINGECGPRVATAIRLPGAGETPTAQ